MILLDFCPQPGLSPTLSQPLWTFCKMTDSWASFTGMQVQWAEVRDLYFTKVPGNCAAACLQKGLGNRGPGPPQYCRPCVRKTLGDRCVCRFPSCAHPRPVSRADVHQGCPIPPIPHGPQIQHCSHSEQHPINSLALRGPHCCLNLLRGFSL